MTAPAHAPADSIFDRVQCAVSRTVVIYTASGRAYAGTLLAADDVSVQVESGSDDFEAPCILEIDATRVEAVEIIKE